MFNAHETYHQVLKSEFEARTNANPRYSLRAFARDLGVSAPRLSRVLRGEQGLSATAAGKIAERMGLSPFEREQFCQMVLAVDARSKKTRKAATQEILKQLKKDPDVLSLENDTFHIISDWYHYAIIELAATKDFRADAKLVAKRLGIQAIEAENAIARLLRAGLLVEKNGKVTREKTVYATSSQNFPSEAIRKFNRQVLEKAIQAITHQTLSERSLGTVTVAVDANSLPRLFEELATFRRRFNRLAEELSTAPGATPSDVYVLSLPFFKLTQSSQENPK